jgi:glycosyltransferase involved in cell wall biosynthesis
MKRVSIVIATYNRAELLSKALLSILNQKAQGVFFEVIVIDNNSKDTTRVMVESLSKDTSVLLKYSFEPLQGKAFALNRGIKEAQGDIIFFSDDDIIADPQWLINMTRCFEMYDCDCVGGRVLPVYPAHTPQWIVDNRKALVGPIVYYDYGIEVKKYQEKLMYEFLGANYGFKKSVFNELGVFRTDIGPGRTLMGEDSEIMRRLIKAQKNIYYCGEALVWHPVDPKRMTLQYIARWNMGLGNCRVMTDEHSRPVILKYILGFPRYLLKIIAQQIGQLCIHVFNPNKFINIWIELFINIGKASQIRRYHLQTARKEIQNETISQHSHLYV